LELVVCEALARLADPDDPMRALVAASNAQTCLASFAHALLDPVRATDVGQAMLALASVLGPFSDDVERGIDQARGGRPHPIRLSYLGDLDAFTSPYVENLRARIAGF
jgi:hypothetical protein